MGVTTDFQLKQDDTSTRTFVLREPDGSSKGKRFDLTGYVPGDLAFFFEPQDTTPPGSALITGAGTFAIAADPTSGEVSYTFAAGDTGNMAGVYRWEIETLNAGVRNTFPQEGYGTLELVADLGDQ